MREYSDRRALPCVTLSVTAQPFENIGERGGVTLVTLVTLLLTYVRVRAYSSDRYQRYHRYPQELWLLINGLKGNGKGNAALPFDLCGWCKGALNISGGGNG